MTDLASDVRREIRPGDTVYIRYADRHETGQFMVTSIEPLVENGSYHAHIRSVDHRNRIQMMIVAVQELELIERRWNG